MPTMQWLATWDDLAKKRVMAATDLLARRLGTPPVDWLARTSRDPIPTAKSVGEREASAIVAEAVVRMSAELDALQVQVAALAEKRAR